MNLTDEFLSVVDVLTGCGIPFAVCGGFAVALHGYPRLTRDIDFMILRSDVERVTAAVGALGYVLTAGDMAFGNTMGAPQDIVRISRAIPGEEDLITLDFLIVGDAMLPHWERRIFLELEGRRVPCIDREGLIQMKRVAGRPKDLEDIAFLTQNESNA